jgi:hypothetical protein
MDMTSLNWLAIISAGLSAFVLGGIWYSPAVFGNAWMEENGVSAERIDGRNMIKVFSVSIALSLLMAFNLAMFLSDSPAECTGACAHKTDMGWGTLAGFLAGLWPLCGIAIVGLFERKSAKYVMINGGYLLAALTLMGSILGAWR